MASVCAMNRYKIRVLFGNAGYDKISAPRCSASSECATMESRAELRITPNLRDAFSLITPRLKLWWLRSPSAA